MDYIKLPPDFYLQDTLTVARQLLGKYIVHETEQGRLVCRITETEAYCGPSDRACHSYQRKSPDGRTNIMYKDGGLSYVYLIYGMYHCFNVVTCPAGQPEAVLIRSAKPIEGMELMRQLRKSKKGTIPKEKDLLTGPGKLCTAMQISREQYGEALWGDRLYLAYGEPVENSNIAACPRINVDYAGEDALLPYRFCDVKCGYLSVKIKTGS